MYGPVGCCRPGERSAAAQPACGADAGEGPAGRAVPGEAVNRLLVAVSGC
jgi:hypothetical protein